VQNIFVCRLGWSGCFLKDIFERRLVFKRFFIVRNGKISNIWKFGQRLTPALFPENGHFSTKNVKKVENENRPS
jgi:hypothetical protein